MMMILRSRVWEQLKLINDSKDEKQLRLSGHSFPHSFGRLRINILSQDTTRALKRYLRAIYEGWVVNLMKNVTTLTANWSVKTKDEKQLKHSNHSFPHPFGRLRINILSQDTTRALKLNAQLKENFIIRVHGNYIVRDPGFCFTSAEGSENYDVELRISFAIIWMLFCWLDLDSFGI
ncbi:hypothetical protein CEXT_731821 [Caerostris extrusa]|uniref:Uncharacterized protein n=1 Tax=Caerostris extrusa TaxID=172846 RepID=A0AAV4NBK3_CAEEX|nr:hypothetical protein CEXT_731821 [Caerostris extrusa]